MWQSSGFGEYEAPRAVFAYVTPNLLKGSSMSDEKRLTVEGFPNISVEAARRVADALEVHERAEEFALALKEREAYALAVRSTGQHTLGSLLEAAEAFPPIKGPYREVKFDFGSPATCTLFQPDADNIFLESQTGTGQCLWGTREGSPKLPWPMATPSGFYGDLLIALRQLGANPTSALWYRDRSCAISGISLENDGYLVILHTSYVRKGGNAR